MIIDISIEQSRQRGLTKRFKELEIYWEMVDSHLEGLSALFSKGRKITFSMEFIYKEVTSNSTTAKGKKKKKSATKAQKIQRAADASLCTQVYKHYHCRGKHCKQGFLGVWLDRKLRWRGHLKKIKAKMETQMYALTNIAASTWGCTLARAREVYTKVVRSAIAYGASAYHTPADPKRQVPRGIAKQLTTTQSSCLRVVTGAYRATQVRSLETEAWVPPLDLYLNKRVAE